MRYFPLFLDLRDRDVLVVGGSGAAVRKALALADCDAVVTVVAEKPDAAMRAAGGSGHLRLLCRPFCGSDVEGRTLVVAACEDAASDEDVSAAARARGVPVNVVDRPELSTFVWPAIVDRDPVTVAVCSGGTAPVLARSIRARIEAMLPANLGRLARFAEGFRSAVKATRRSGAARRRFWDRFFQGPIAAQVLAGDERGARERMFGTINRSEDLASEEGIVHLVGAGPGDPELLTLKALRLLQQADVIVHDRLVGPRILEYARRDADRIDVGKAPGRHPVSQDQINALLLGQARAGCRVVRLKGGDPFVFGRGGEERDYLLRHGVRVEVVPGITAATGCAAAAGIPLTLRGEAQMLSIVTGHGEQGDPDLDWRALAQDGRTICVYMGASTADRMARSLIAHGRNPATPAAVIVNGTLPEQQVLTGLLRDLPTLVNAAESGPVLILIGDVVRRAEAWSEPAAPAVPAVAALN